MNIKDVKCRESEVCIKLKVKLKYRDEDGIRSWGVDDLENGCINPHLSRDIWNLRPKIQILTDRRAWQVSEIARKRGKKMQPEIHVLILKFLITPESLFVYD